MSNRLLYTRCDRKPFYTAVLRLVSQRSNKKIRRGVFAQCPSKVVEIAQKFYYKLLKYAD